MTTLQSIIIQLESLGLTNLLIPLILIFAVIFAILNIIKIFKKSINLVVSLVISLLTVIPHITGSYPACYDIVLIINTATPKIGLVMIAVIMFLLVIGLFGLKLDFFTKFLPIIAIIAVIITIISFLTSGPAGCAPLIRLDLPYSEILYYLLPVLIMFLVILFSTKSGKKRKGPEEPY